MAIHTSLGTSTADSYVSVASANSYFEALENSEGWLNISDESSTTTIATTTKENLLKQATREIDRSYRYVGSKYNQGIRGQSTYQALEFPRSSNIDANADLILPEEIKYATYEQALWIRERNRLKTGTETNPAQFKIIGENAYNYLAGWINRQVRVVNKYPWQGSNY